MAQFQGFICDNCEAIIKAEDRTKVKTRYEGPTIEGDVKYDLCPDCTEADVQNQEQEGREIEPIKRRRKRKDTPTTPPVEGHSDEDAQEGQQTAS